MSLLAITGFAHLPKNTTSWITYRPDFVNQWAASTRGDQVNNDGYLYTTGASDDLLQFDIAKTFQSSATAFWVSFKMKVLATGVAAASQNLLLFDTAQAPNTNPSRPFQALATASILPGYATGQEYQIDIKFDKVAFTYTILVNGVQAATGSVNVNVRPYLTSGAFFLCGYMRQSGSAGQLGYKAMVVYDNVNNGDGVNDYLGLIDVDRADIVSAESVTPGDWTPVVGGDTLLQGITKPIETATTGVTTVKTTALDVGISLTVPNTKRIRGIGFLTSSKTTSGGTPLHEDFGGVTGAPIAQKTTLTHGQRSTIFTADPNGFIWTEETANAAKLSIIAG